MAKPTINSGLYLSGVRKTLLEIYNSLTTLTTTVNNLIKTSLTTSNSRTYSCTYINDQLANLKKSAATVFCQNKIHNGGKWSVINFTVTDSKVLNSGFSISGNYVVVNKDMQGVIASATMSLTSDSYSYSGDIYIIQWRNNKWYRTYECRGIDGSGAKQLTTPQCLFEDVKSGDKFTFGHYTGSASDTFTTLNNTSTFMTVQEI